MPSAASPLEMPPNATGAAPAGKLPNGLRYVDDSRPGYTRRRTARGFAYFDRDDKRIDDPHEITRIDALAIPPAYTAVWICPDPRGHLQATGRDARGRKQYRYHPQWREIRDADKYQRMAAFGAALPRIRARVARDMKRKGMCREKVIATVVRLLDTTLVRVGNVEYARENGSFGLTTLRKRHLKHSGGHLRFKFTGKSGVEHDVSIDDPRVARIVRRCAELPGHDLFQYLDESGERHTVESADISDYLQRATGAEFTAKDYRTWGGSRLALTALLHLANADDAHIAAPTTAATATPSTTPPSKSHIQRQVVATVKAVSTLLRNTPAVCRRCYIHPAVISAFEAGALSATRKMPARRGLRADETALLALLEQARTEAVRPAQHVLAGLSRMKGQVMSRAAKPAKPPRSASQTLRARVA